MNRTRLSDFTFTFHFHTLEKEMATNSSVLAWRIPGMGEPSGLPSTGSHRIRHDWSDLAAAAADVNRGFSDGTSGKEHTCQCRRHKRGEFDPWLGRSPEEGHGNDSIVLPEESPCTEEPGGLQFIGSQRVRHN